MTNAALVLLAIPVTSNMSVRVGPMDMLAYLPRNNSIAYHQIGGFLALSFDTLGANRRVRGLQPFLYISAYTHHAHRNISFPVNFMVGVEMAVVLAPTPRRR